MINWFLIVSDGVERGDYPMMHYQYPLIVADGVEREDYPTMYYQYLFSGRPKGLVKKEVYQKLDTPLF